MSKVSALREIRGDHEFSLSDDFSKSRKRVTQTRFFKAGDILVAVAELNRPNHWNDPKFDAACEFLQTAWSLAASAMSASGQDAEGRLEAKPASAVPERQTPQPVQSPPLSQGDE